MKLAVIFPGQGSQSTGMLNELSEFQPIILDTFKVASDTLGFDLWDIIQNDTTGKLNQTAITQPAMLASGFAVYKVCQSVLNIKPQILSGHSLGEYTALVAAESITFKDAIKLVAKRGELMQQAVPEGVGAMAAILGLPDDTVKHLCADISGVVEAVNFNSPGQVVIAGEKPAVETACLVAKEQGAKRALVLPVSVPSHSSLMKPVADEFADFVKAITIKSPSIPVVNNVDASIVNEPDAISDALIRQLYNPVLWTDSVQLMANNGISHFIESGPGKVLAGLTKRINKTLITLPVFDNKTLEKLTDILTKRTNNE